MDEHGWVLHNIDSTILSTSLPLFIFEGTRCSFKIFSSILLPGIHSFDNLFAYIAISSGSSHLFSSVFGRFLNRLGHSFLMSGPFLFESHESVLDDGKGDVEGDLFSLIFFLILFFSYPEKGSPKFATILL